MKAAIDIGTNTVLLLVAEVDEGRVVPVFEAHRSPRLGKGVDADRNINDDATGRVIAALKEYREILEDRFGQIENIIVTATSAVRDASNREEFIEKVRKETGFKIRLLTGREEAEWTAAGALSVVEADVEEVMILDIGGGSTEVALLKEGSVIDAYSFDMGSVRFTERFLISDPPAKEEVANCRKAASDLYNTHVFNPSGNFKAVGVAGTLTSLAGIRLGLDKYEPNKINNYLLKQNDINDVIEAFMDYPHEELLDKHPVYLAGRSDIFMAGMLILEGFLKSYGLSEILVSTGGIRHGAILKT